jgi:hypothetical protein
LESARRAKDTNAINMLFLRHKFKYDAGGLRGMSEGIEVKEQSTLNKQRHSAVNNET